MENESSSSECIHVFYYFFIGLLSFKLVSWDFNIIANFVSEPSLKIWNLWSLAVFLTFSAGWYLFLVTKLILAYDKKSLIKYVKILFLVLFGPNLFIWNLIGLAINGFKFKSFITTEGGIRLHPAALLSKLLVWGILFSISILCSCKMFTLLTEYFRKLRIIRRFKQSKQIKAGALIGECCPVCLSNFAEEEVICELKCGHRFHSNCVQVWIEEKGTCPICRREFEGLN